MELIPALTLTFVLLLLEHYFPWPNWFSLRWKRVHVIFNYTLGVLGFMLPLTAYLAQRGLSQTALVVWAFVVTAGAAVSLAYALDWLSNYLHKRKMENAKTSRND